VRPDPGRSIGLAAFPPMEPSMLRRILARALAPALLLVGLPEARAVDDPRFAADFVQGLRERGYYDLALHPSGLVIRQSPSGSAAHVARPTTGRTTSGRLEVKEFSIPRMGMKGSGHHATGPDDDEASDDLGGRRWPAVRDQE